MFKAPKKSKKKQTLPAKSSNSLPPGCFPGRLGSRAHWGSAVAHWTRSCNMQEKHQEAMDQQPSCTLDASGPLRRFLGVAVVVFWDSKEKRSPGALWGVCPFWDLLGLVSGSLFLHPFCPFGNSNKTGGIFGLASWSKENLLGGRHLSVAPLEIWPLMIYNALVFCLNTAFRANVAKHNINLTQ